MPYAMNLKAIDFFCGAGGMTYGLRQAGINVVAGIDNNLSCKETYTVNNPDSMFIHEDITSYSPQKLLNVIEIKKRDDDLIFIGCSPCQYWTKIQTNKMRSENTKNLLSFFENFVAFFLPGYVIIENVPGLLSNKNESILSDFLCFLEKHNYHVAYDIIDASKHGVPQTRKRFLLIASRLSIVDLPPIEPDSGLIVKRFLGESNGFDKIPDGRRDETDFLHTSSLLSPLNKKRISSTPKNGGTRMSWKDNPELQLLTYRDKDNSFTDVYGRMYWDRPAPTITTRFHSLSNGRFGHPEENRAISLREGATLQTFPKSYIFKGSSITDIAKQIGNAVPPELAKRIGKEIIRSHTNAKISN